MELNRRLEGKTAVVTAAGQGIGRATALRLAAEGAQVIATDINAEALEMLAATPNLTTRVLDVLDADAVHEFARELSASETPVNVLFNCAGFVHAGAILDAQEDEWDFAFNLNVKSMYRMIRAFLPGMLAAGGGSIINMSSVAGAVTGAPNRLIYNASKAAVAGMTRGVAADYVTQGIRCNAICPGTVDSPSLHQRLRETGDYEAALAGFIARQPMGRIGAPEEVAALVAYLASDESGFTTGQEHIIDGGWTT